MKIVVNDVKTGQSFQKEVEKTREALFYGKRVGEEFDGGVVGLEGYKLRITGGSNRDGTPMRGDIAGVRKAFAIISKGPGLRHPRKGLRLKKRVVGNTVSPEIIQLNAVITAYGVKPLSELGFVAKEKKPVAGRKEAEEKKEEKAASEKEKPVRKPAAV